MTQQEYVDVRRFPRTLVEAFGPYASGPIHDPNAQPARGPVLAAGATLLLIGLFAALW